MASLLNLFAEAVARHPNRIAIVDGDGRETSFRTLDDHTRTLAARWQKQGVRHGDRVILAAGISADLYASLAALWSIGATVVLPEPAMGLKGLRHAIRTTKPRAFCAMGWYIALKYLLPELWSKMLLRPGSSHCSVSGHGAADDDIALISFTSGTTGPPKAIPRSHAFLNEQYKAVAPLLQSEAVERDLVTFPVFTLVNLADGRVSILPNWKMNHLDRLTPGQLGDWLRDQRITRVLAPPSVCELLAQAPTPASLTTIFSGGGPVFPDLISKLSQKTGARVACIYGSTEAEPIAFLDAADISDRDQEQMAQGHGLLVGSPIPNLNVRIVDDEVQVAGPHVNSSYLDPEKNAETKVVEGHLTWHRTGDAGAFDAEGRLWLLGGVGSVVKTANQTLYPFAIETAARYWPGVDRSALLERNSLPVLAVQGDASHLTEWSVKAKALGVEKVSAIAKIPLDQRHWSKVDRSSLKRLLSL